jgi:hypothetical protein
MVGEKALVQEVADALRLSRPEGIAWFALLGRLRELRLQVVEEDGQPTGSEPELDLEAITGEEPGPLRVVGIEPPKRQPNRRNGVSSKTLRTVDGSVTVEFSLRSSGAAVATRVRPMHSSPVL